MMCLRRVAFFLPTKLQQYAIEALVQGFVIGLSPVMISGFDPQQAELWSRVGLGMIIAGVGLAVVAFWNTGSDVDPNEITGGW